MKESLQPIAFGGLFNLNLQSQLRWFLFNGTRQKRPIELDHRLRFENEIMTLQMQQAVRHIVRHCLTLTQKSPTHTQKSPTHAQKSPTHTQKSPTYVYISCTCIHSHVYPQRESQISIESSHMQTEP